ncbi:MAG: hypothetical protein JNK82_14165 [Myxococcaceae bacterium]|nr:hypothetical protein [Myxococcaceae bacterium]
MPAEGIHFSVLGDSGVSSSAAKLGALFVDLPYFDAFWWGVVRYLAKVGPAPSPWGDVTHHKAPIAVGRGLMEEGVRLKGEEGAWLRALAAGYICHAAVDRSMHPHINALARARAERLGDTPQRQHLEVEKYQSILFHDARYGFEVMGTQALLEHCDVDASPLWKKGPVSDAVQRVLKAAWGKAPSRGLFRSWANGYSSYVKLISGPLGRRVAPRPEKEAARDEVFTGFHERYDAALKSSRRWMSTLQAYGDDGVFDASARAALESEMPEGTIDPK